MLYGGDQIVQVSNFKEENSESQEVRTLSNMLQLKRRKARVGIRKQVLTPVPLSVGPGPTRQRKESLCV